MNCANCGTEIELGFLCKKCEETAARSVIDGARKASTLLSPREAIIAMLDGAVLETGNGMLVRFNGIENTFVSDDTNQPFYCFTNLYHKPKPKTRPMDTFECLAWVNSPDSLGWMVRAQRKDKVVSEWDIPQRFKYDGKEWYLADYYLTYQRAKVLPDKSGIDKSTIQGFLVEVV